MYTPDPEISIVIPCMNEEGNIALLVSRIADELQGKFTYEIIVVDDGSTDGTLGELKKQGSECVRYLSFSRNFGHQYALKAGIDYARGKAVISMDADLQHPPELLLQMIAKWKEGYEVVYTIRNDEGSSAFKRVTARFFYKLINASSDIAITQGAADFRLIDRKVADVLKHRINEYHLFYRGLISWVGFSQYGIAYVPAKRHSGETKYSLLKMVNFAINGITSFSVRPLRIGILLGLGIAAFSLLYALYAFYIVLFTDRAVQGWASVIISVLFVGGLNMVLLGILGEYLGKLYFESKNRPHYIVRETNIPPDGPVGNDNVANG